MTKSLSIAIPKESAAHKYKRARLKYEIRKQWIENMARSKIKSNDDIPQKILYSYIMKIWFEIL